MADVKQIDGFNVSWLVSEKGHNKINIWSLKRAYYKVNQVIKM